MLRHKKNPGKPVAYDDDEEEEEEEDLPLIGNDPPEELRPPAPAQNTKPGNPRLLFIAFVLMLFGVLTLSGSAVMEPLEKNVRAPSTEPTDTHVVTLHEKSGGEAVSAKKEDQGGQLAGTKSNNPECIGDSPINEIILRGERHTGTNLVMQVLKKNLAKAKVEVNSPFYGWKHGLLPPRAWGQPIPADEKVVLVITRGVFTWLPKMYKESYDYHMNEKRNTLTFSEFIRYVGRRRRNFAVSVCPFSNINL